MERENLTLPQKRLKSSILEKLNSKTTVTCSKVPECLFDAKVAEKHFSKFGRVLSIRMLLKKHMCIVEYEQPSSAERAVMNAGAYDGFMFDVTRTKPRVRRKSKKDDDPDWVPDEDVEAELSALSALPVYRLSRQKSMEVEVRKKSPIQAKPPIRKKTITPRTVQRALMSQPASRTESPAPMTLPTTLNTSDAATELHQLRFKISLTADEQWRTLDARDRILRAWGGAGSRVKIGGATIGTCPDMCPEKERLHRQAEHQVMSLETAPGSEGLDPWRAVKQYSRSSADQEMPMCYELRPASALMRTGAYLLNEVADTTRQVSLADWFHFMWDRFRGIRKDITQQALCCSESIILVEMCARFHAHCAASLADLEHTQFDQKLNTDNLTKCLQTLKHMYADVSPEKKPNEAEFRGYIALLNLGDSNFWWEVKQLPQEIQKSNSITFAIKIFIALDSNNYVRFFRLVREKATYLQACILLRYFNDVRARALSRIVKAYAPRGGSQYPVDDLMNALAFETTECMKSFINHYGLRLAKNVEEMSVILNRNHFIEDSDPYPLSRSIQLIESKRKETVGEVISGGKIPSYNNLYRKVYSSFNSDGKLKETALIAEDLQYNTLNDSNKNTQSLKAELQKLCGAKIIVPEQVEPHKRLFSKLDSISHKVTNNVVALTEEKKEVNLYSFQPAIPIASADDFKNTAGLDTKKIYSFSKPKEMESSNRLFSSTVSSQNVFNNKFGENKSIFDKSKDASLVRLTNAQTSFTKPTISSSLFSQQLENSPNITEPENNNKLFSNATNVFSKKDDTTVNKNVFERPKANTNIFSKAEGGGIFAKPPFKTEATNIFARPSQENQSKHPAGIFGSLGNSTIFPSIQNNYSGTSATNGETLSTVSPGNLFKSVNQIPSSEAPKYTIFQSKNKATSVAESIFSSVNLKNTEIYDFNTQKDEIPKDIEQKLIDERKKDDDKVREEIAMKQEKERLENLKKQEEERRIIETERKMKELRKQEEKRKNEEEMKQKQEELKKKLEAERKAEQKRKAAEQDRLFKERVDKESEELLYELINEVTDETVKYILTEEIEQQKKLLLLAEEVTNEVYSEVVDDMIHSELIAEVFRIKNIRKKWYYIWRKHFIRNYKRRNYLENTPIWLTDNTPQEKASHLKRVVEEASLKGMNAFHRGYKFLGELNEIPPPPQYNIVDIIRSAFLKRMKQIQYPYDKCFFWKFTLVSTGATKWICKKINVEKWLLDAFSDRKHYDVSNSLIYVGKQSWNNLMEFAISVSLMSNRKDINSSEALEGSNGILLYTTENDNDILTILEDAMNHKYPYQVVPVAIIMPTADDLRMRLEEKLMTYKNNNTISDFRFFIVDQISLGNSLNLMTKNALKWLAKKYPKPPPLEIDFLKSICQRYLGNEIWCKLKSETSSRKNFKDLEKLIKCYNNAVGKLTDFITNEDLFNYTPFPLEFKQFLSSTSPFPKPYEFIASNIRSSDNVSGIRRIMEKLKLPLPNFKFMSRNIINMQAQVQKYCHQINWFENPEEVTCRIIALLPNELSDMNMPYDQFLQFYERYDLIDFLNIIVYEQIRSLHKFENLYAVYKKSDLEDYRNILWMHDLECYSTVFESNQYEDELDYFIEAKRRKIAEDSQEYLMLEDKDCTIVEENIQMADKNISTYSNCQSAVIQLQQQLDEEKKKSEELENLLRSALSSF